jgi:hypothetical protein
MCVCVCEQHPVLLIGHETSGARGLPKIRIIAGRWIEDIRGRKSRNSTGVAHIEVLISVTWIRPVEECICIFRFVPQTFEDQHTCTNSLTRLAQPSLATGCVALVVASNVQCQCTFEHVRTRDACNSTNATQI